MSDYARACPLAEVVEGRATAVTVEGVPVCLVRSDGEVYAIYDECSHQAIALSEGEVDDGTIECWLHGSTFDLATGRPLSLPATEPVPVYPVKIDGDDVYVAVKES